MKLADKFALGLGALSLAIVAAAAQAPAPNSAPSQTPSPATSAQPAPQGTAPGQAAAGGRGGRGGRGGTPAYPVHAQADDATIARGETLFRANCSFCHGADARGGDTGPNLVRSQLVMNDDKGELIGQVVQNGRPTLGMPKFDLTNDQVRDIAGYIHKVGASYRTIVGAVSNIVVGDPKAGETFFNGPVGKCNTCHSVTGDLAGIGGRMEPRTLQDALVSGGGGGRGRGAASADPRTAITAKVTLPGGKVVEGKLDRIDDFTVSLVMADDSHVSFARNGDVPKVELNNPLAAHRSLLKVYSDDDIHNLTAYLVTLK